MHDRLYIVVRGDLPPGLQLAQAVHAAFSFSDEWPEFVIPWHQDSNYLVVVNVPDEDALFDLIMQAPELEHSLVREPDLGDAATAVAFKPGVVAQKLCASLPLALRERALMP